MTETDPIERATRELLAIHARSRDAHFAKDVEALMEIQPDDFLYVGHGIVRNLTRADMRRNIEEAFGNATYHAFDDLEPPIVRISADGNLAWMIVQIKVRKAQTSATGSVEVRESIHANIRTFERRDGRWLMTATT